MYLNYSASLHACKRSWCHESNKVSSHAAKANQCWLSPASQPPLSVSAWHQCEGSNMYDFMHIWTWALTTHHTASCVHVDRQFQLWKDFTAPTSTLMCNMFTNPATLPLSVSCCPLNLSPPLSLCVRQNSICSSVYTPGSILPKCPVRRHWSVNSLALKSCTSMSSCLFLLIPYITNLVTIPLLDDLEVSRSGPRGP